MDDDRARSGILDAAEELYYGRGIRAVGMDELRARAGVSLKLLYRLYPSKEELVVAVLDRRDRAWRGRLAAHVAGASDPRERLLAVFDWLGLWFAEPGFRGCAWINSYGEMGATSPAIAARARDHKSRFRADLGGWVADAGLPPGLAEELLLLAEGAMVTAAIFGTPEPAARARAAAARLIDYESAQPGRTSPDS
ncbi:MAG: TetR/AcrR family transcriptional regulator [Thermoleophilia bacterium]